MWNSVLRSIRSHLRVSGLALRPSRLRPSAQTLLRAIAGIAATAVCMVAANGAGFAQTIHENAWATNGPVYAMVRDGGTIYIGGSFTHVGHPTGGLVPLDAATGTPTSSFPKVSGRVYAMTPDGTGGWYIGGTFTAVGGVPRANLAHVASDLSVSPWDPSPNGTIHHIAVIGTTLHVSGYFSEIGGQARYNLAAVDATTGVATAWNPAINGDVYSMVATGSTVYVGGEFSQIGGQVRICLAALDATTGLATAWAPNPDGWVYNLALRGSTILVGGLFTSIGGVARMSFWE